MKRSISVRVGHCIICHQDDVELSDEHVIPDAIGGYYHIYNVCKECNSKLGESVDIHLLKHWLTNAARYAKGLAGKTGKIPNPLTGEGIMEDGCKVRVEESRDGKIVPHILPNAPVVSEDAKSFSFCVDEKDRNLIPKIAQKMKKKMGCDDSLLTSSEVVHQIDNPCIRMQANIDLKNYKIGLLKIAYEFAVDKIPEYYNDSKAKLYAEILREANLDRLDEVAFVGDGLTSQNVKPLEEYIDYTNTDRHILMLLNIQGKLHCIVKLFDKAFCQMICMSDKAYGEEGLVSLAINNFVKHECKFYDIHELLKTCMLEERTCYRFSEEALKLLKAEEHKDNFGIVCNNSNDNVLFDQYGQPVTTQEILLLRLEQQNNVKENKEETKGNSVSSTYVVPDDMYFRLMPSNKLIQVLEITKINDFKKI